MVTVAQWMTEQAITIGPDEALDAAMARMRGHHVRHLLVIDEGGLAGILSDRDIRRALPSPLCGGGPEEYRRALERVTVRQVMTRDPATVEPDTELRAAATLLLRGQYSALPVEAGGVVRGIITESDCLRALCALLDAGAHAPGRSQRDHVGAPGLLERSDGVAAIRPHGR